MVHLTPKFDIMYSIKAFSHVMRLLITNSSCELTVKKIAFSYQNLYSSLTNTMAGCSSTVILLYDVREYVSGLYTSFRYVAPLHLNYFLKFCIFSFSCMFSLF